MYKMYLVIMLFHVDDHPPSPEILNVPVQAGDLL